MSSAPENFTPEYDSTGTYNTTGVAQRGWRQLSSLLYNVHCSVYFFGGGRLTA